MGATQPAQSNPAGGGSMFGGGFGSSGGAGGTGFSAFVLHFFTIKYSIFVFRFASKSSAFGQLANQAGGGSSSLFGGGTNSSGTASFTG